MTPPQPPPEHGPPEAGRAGDAHGSEEGTQGQETPEQAAHDQPWQHTLKYAGRTDPGLMRSNNEDSFVVGPRLLAVADGMGGHAAGEVASKLVVDALAPLNSGPLSTDPITALGEATRTGNTAIAHLVARHPELEGMGTTVTALLFDGPHVALAHVGDSRGYLYRSGVLHQLTHDDTFVQSLVDEGRITEQQAHEHPQRNLVLRALTGIPVEPLLTARETAAGDRYLLCSDGLCGVVGAEAIADALAEPELEDAADTLINLALAAGGPDNVTVVVVDVVATGRRLGDTTPLAAVPADDPSSTSPIAQLTREMPRVPLPPIPEEPAAEAEILDEETDLDDDDDGELDDVPESDSGDAHGDGSESRETPPRRRRSGRDDQSERSGKRRWYRRGAVLVAGLVLLTAAGVASTIWVRHQYYVSDQGNLVVVFRGVNGSLLGWDFSTFEETSCAGETECSPMKVSDLQPAARNLVHAGIKASSLEGARTVVQRLSEQLLPECPEPVRPPESSPEPTPTSQTETTRSTAESSPTETSSTPTPSTTASIDDEGAGETAAPATIPATTLATVAAAAAQGRPAETLVAGGAVQLGADDGLAVAAPAAKAAPDTAENADADPAAPDTVANADADTAAPAAEAAPGTAENADADPAAAAAGPVLAGAANSLMMLADAAPEGAPSRPAGAPAYPRSALSYPTVAPTTETAPPSSTVEPTDLPPAMQVPGVTCRIVT